MRKLHAPSCSPSTSGIPTEEQQQVTGDTGAGRVSGKNSYFLVLPREKFSKKHSAEIVKTFYRIGQK